MHQWREVARGAFGDDELLVVHGNCQAEALRVLCAQALEGEVRSVRIPPVFELEPDDLADFEALIRRTTYLVSQPVVDDYRGMPLGSAQIATWLPASARMVRVPVLRWAALMPTQAIVRAAGVGDPPVVPYHDLRVLAAAAKGAAVADLSDPSPAAVRAVRDISREQLAVRQEHHGTVDALSVLEDAGAEAVWTINHPQNVVLLGVADRVLAELSTGRAARDPGRVLLPATVAPLREATLAALSLEGSPRTGWEHQGRTYTEDEIAAAHLQWYREHPHVVDAGLRRHRTTLDALDLGV